VHLHRSIAAVVAAHALEGNAMRRLSRLTPLLVLPVLTLAATVLPAAAAPKKLFRSTGDIDVTVPDQDSVTKRLFVGRAGTIKDLDVLVAANHTVICDLTIMLRSPQGRVVHLTSTNGGNGNGYGSDSVDGCDSTMTFDDEASQAVEDFDGVDHLVEGAYRPESRTETTATGGLATFDGLNMKGTWDLIVTDTDQFAPGEPECFASGFTYTPIG
jgi:subtilisin-like proprotein convertase family protein